MTLSKASLGEALAEWVDVDDEVTDAARFVERLLPAKCEHGETAPHDFDNQWQGGLVRVVAEALFDGENYSAVLPMARAVLSVLVGEVGP